MRSRILLQTPDWRVGEFACAPGDPAWHEVNTNMGAWPHVVFPRSHVLIAQDTADRARRLAERTGLDALAIAECLATYPHGV